MWTEECSHAAGERAGTPATDLARGFARSSYKPQDCPRYDRCSANVCPLDADWRKRSHVRGDEVCFFLTESVKADAAGNFASLGLEWLLDRANHVRTDVALPDSIKNTVERARNTGSRIVNQRLAAERLRRRGAK